MRGLPLAHRHWLQMPDEAPPGERLATLPEGFEARTARHQNRLPWRTTIEHARQPGFPVAHLVQLVKHEKFRSRRPTLRKDHPAVGKHSPIEHLRSGEFLRQWQGERGLARLPWTRQEDHLASKIAGDPGRDEALHSRFRAVFRRLCGKKSILGGHTRASRKPLR